MKEIKIKDLRQFGLVLGGILGLFGTIHFFKGHFKVYPWFFGVGGVSLSLAIIVPIALKPFFIVFTKVAHAIGWFNTRVILAIVYYLILTPIGLVMRLFGKDPLNRRVDKTKETYWTPKPAPVSLKESLEKQF